MASQFDDFPVEPSEWKYDRETMDRMKQNPCGANFCRFTAELLRGLGKSPKEREDMKAQIGEELTEVFNPEEAPQQSKGVRLSEELGKMFKLDGAEGPKKKIQVAALMLWQIMQ